MNYKKSCQNIFNDFSKAFDTINHHILFRKLELCGIRKNALRLLHSYLVNRKECVWIGKELSTYRDVTIGVPQGSILGPLLFLLYINDLSSISNLCLPILYADDTTICLKNSSNTDLIHNANLILNNLFLWTTANRISLNIDKTFFLFVSTCSDPIETDCLKLNNQIIQCKKSGKFLGVIIDDKLKFNLHINSICNKISKSIGKMHRLRYMLPTICLFTLYYWFINPYLMYCNLVWGGTHVIYLFYRTFIQAAKKIC